MKFSFRVLVVLQTTLIVFGMLSIRYSYLGIPIGLIGAILLIVEIQTHYEERDDLRRRLTHEALVVLDETIRISNARPIPFSDWSSRSEGFKADVLGASDYKLWKLFYDRLEERNEFLLRSEVLIIQDLIKYNRSCFNAFAEVFDTISWVNQSDLKVPFSNLLSKANKEML